MGRYAQNGRRCSQYFLFVLDASRDIFCVGNEFLLNSNLVQKHVYTGCIFVYQKIKINRYLPITVIIIYNMTSGIVVQGFHNLHFYCPIEPYMFYCEVYNRYIKSSFRDRRHTV